MVRLLTYPAITVLAFASIWWLAETYYFSLRDPKFLDGWILFAGMAAQLLFHIRRNVGVSRRLHDARRTQTHIVIGFVVIGAFAVHTGTGLPDAFLEWALWGLFVLVVVSGIVGSYLMVAVPVKIEQHSTPVAFEDIAKRRLELAQQAEVLATTAEDAESLRAIWQLYSTKLRRFFNGPKNLVAHLKGSKLPLKRLCHQIETAELVSDELDRKTLQSLKGLVVEKNDLDFQQAHLGLLRAWTFVHVPATYGLIVLTILHIAVVYAFSSGVP
ncbi:MAG: hypothetical protein ACERJ2_15430 [Filomicrobium sp.]